MEGRRTQRKGRPRTVTDTQITERRRTQLRLAQQKYRNRKENTISTLQNRVRELEVGIEQLSHSFLTFSNLLLETTALEQYPRTASAFRNITQQCLSLARAGCDDPDERDPADPAGATRDERNQNNGWDNSYLSPQVKEIPLKLLPTPADCPEQPQPPSSPAYHSLVTVPFGLVVAPPDAEPTTTLTSSPRHIPLASFIEEKQWTVSQRLVIACYQNGYELLVNHTNDAKVQAVFGSTLSPTDRTSLMSDFRAVIQDDMGDLINITTTCLTLSRPKNNRLTSEGFANLSRTSLRESSATGEWLDANGVQEFVYARGFCVQRNESAFSGPRFDRSFDVTAFVNLLSLNCICVGYGPAFRRQNVEDAMRLSK